MSKKLIIDFDNTIVNSTKAFVEVHNLICGREYMFSQKEKPRWDLVKRYDFKDQIPKLSTIMKKIIFDNKMFYEKLEYYDEAKEILQELSHKTEVQIVSMCSVESCTKKALKLQEDLPLVKFQPIIYPNFHDKSHVDMRNGIFIDDVMKNLVTSSADKNICFKYQGITQDINKDWRGEVLTKWDNDTYKYLKELLEIK